MKFLGLFPIADWSFQKRNPRDFPQPTIGAEPELKLSAIPIRPIPLTSLVRLYDLEVDPTEQNDISNSNLEVVEFMLAQLVAYNQTQVPGMLIKNLIRKVNIFLQQHMINIGK